MSLLKRFLDEIAGDFEPNQVANVSRRRDTSAEMSEFESVNLYDLDGFRPSSKNQGAYRVVLVVDEPLQDQQWRVLLDSALLLLKADGFLLVRYTQNESVTIQSLKRFMFRKWGISAQVIAEEFIDGNVYTGFSIQQTRNEGSALWTFGILTNGRKVKEVTDFCRSVREYGGNDHEILIVGPADESYEPYNVSYVADNSNQNFASICMKKNALVAKSKHENVCITHDRYVLNEDFFTGFEEFGYNFDFITVRQFHESGKIYPSYCAIQDGGNLSWGPIFNVLDDRWTWTSNYLNGGLIIAKRSLLVDHPFNDLIFHNQAEDVELAREMFEVSVVPRINKFSSATTNVPDALTEAFESLDREPSHSYAAVKTFPFDVDLYNRIPETIYKKLARALVLFANARESGKSLLDILGLILSKFGFRVPKPRFPSKPRRKPPLDAGISFLLYAGDSGGVLNLTVHYLNELDRIGAKFEIVDIERGARESVLPANLIKYVVDSPTYPTIVWCLGFPFMEDHINNLKSWSSGRWNICFTHWELPRIPSRLKTKIRGVDEFWVTSEFVAGALTDITRKNISMIDPKVDFARWNLATLKREDFGLPPQKFLYLINWEFTSSTKRKNPEAAIFAFRDAFGESMFQGVGLVVQVKFDARHGESVERECRDYVAKLKLDYPWLIVIEATDLTYEESLTLKMLTDCYVSLHRSEGYGMGGAEALALGKYCIMTGWSGNLSYAGKPEWRDRVFLVDYDLVPVRESDFTWVHGSDSVEQTWAEVRPVSAKEAFATVHETQIELNESRKKRQGGNGV